MRKLIKPDFTNSVVNLSATLAEFLGCPNEKPTLPALAAELQKGYKNVVFMLLDGLGMHPIEKNLPENSFLRRHIRQVLTSVFPSTTTNATTSIQTNTYPMEHGWFGWSLYFEELHRAVDIFLDRDSATGELVGEGYTRRRLPTIPFYTRGRGDYTANVVVPPFWREENNRFVWTNLDEFFAQIVAVCGKEGKQFIYAYCTEPDSTMHRYGVTSSEAEGVIVALDGGAEKLYATLSDTLLIVAADHGQIDVGGCVEIYKDEELLSLLEWPPYLEARASAFKVKEGCKGAFEKMFTEKYGADFTLFKTEELIAENYFGGNIKEHARLLGDYIAVGITDKIMKLTPRGHEFKGHHTSLTEEMEVPLIFVGTEPHTR